VPSRDTSYRVSCDGVPVPPDLGPLIADQWRLIEAHRRAEAPRDGREGGRPRADDRECLEAILWALVTGRAGRGWKKLPLRYPSPATCARRLAEWRGAGIWLEALWRDVAMRPAVP
jgi:transposase